MGSNVLTVNIWRFALLVIVQGLILSNINLQLGWLRHLHIIVYSVFIMLLPLRTPPIACIGLGFVIGFSIDLFTNTIGMHAMAGSFVGLARTAALGVLRPPNGYNLNLSPTRVNMGSAWIIRYAAIMIAAHLIYFFSVESFTFVRFGEILKNFLVSYPFSLLAALMVLFGINSKS